MGKRGPKPSGKFAKKGATLGARITIDTRKRLEAAAKVSGLSLSEEVETRLAQSLSAENETEQHLLNLIRECIRRTDGFTGQSWITDAYTFDLMLGAVELLALSLRPEGEARLPETMQWLRGAAGGPPQIQKQMRAMIENEPPTAFAHAIAGGLIIDLQQRGVQVSRVERALYKRAAEYLAGLLTSPVLEQHDAMTKEEPST